jgi:XRE family aerobic/anaerobic benzoate catabolism transcriptional regulator
MNAERLLHDLGRRVRGLRGQRGQSLRELALRAQLSTRFLVQLESGAANISVRKLVSLARALGTTPATLLAGPGGAAELPVIALLGLRGAGKSTIGRRLARRLKIPFVELDRRIERAAELSLAEIFALHGEGYYRRLERELLEAILAAGRPVVLATGGGIVNAGETWALLKRRALTLWLRADPEDHWNRVVQQGDRRPMAEHPEAMAELRRLLAERSPLYAQAAHSVDTSRAGIDGTLRAVEKLARLASPPPAPARRPSRSTRPTGS